MGVFDPRNVDTMFIGERGLTKPQVGDVGLFSQSGALGCSLLNEVGGNCLDLNRSLLEKLASTGFPSSFRSVMLVMWMRRIASTTMLRIPL